jgi:hypothetical protein
MTVADDSKPSPIDVDVDVDDSYLDNIENMVAVRDVNDDVVEHLLSERLLDGFLLLERSCPACSTPLVKEPLDLKDNNGGQNPLSPNSSKKAISIIHQIHTQESAISCSDTPRAPSPIAGVPFCVNCKAHVVTQESEIQYLDTEHNTMKNLSHQGKILLDLLRLSPSPHPDMYETTTMTSTSTHFQAEALRQRQRNNIGNSTTVSIRSAPTNSSGMLARAGSSTVPAPITTTSDNANTNAKSTVAPSTLDEGESVVPVPDDDRDDEEEAEEQIEVSITPMSVTQDLPSPAASTLLCVAISEDQAPPQQDQEQLLDAIISSRSVGGVQEEKKEADDHEDDSVIEISYDEENSETYEVIHISDDTDVVEEGRRIEYTIERKTTETSESSTKHSPTAQIKTHLSPTSEGTDVASAHAGQIDQTLSNLESHAAQIDQTLSNLEAGNQAASASKNHASVDKANTPVAGAKSLATEKETPVTANTDVHPPKLVIEQTEAKQIPHASTEMTSAATANNEINETAGDGDDVLPEYSVR